MPIWSVRLTVTREAQTMTKVSGHPILHALWLSLGSASAQGLARFAYALMLPSMKDSLGWTFAQAGGMNSANAAGYLVGAFMANFVLMRWSPRSTFIASALITSASLIAMGGASQFWVLLAFRLVGGISSAVLFIAGGVLGAQLASVDRSRSGLLLAIYYGGVGIGVILSGICIPWLLASSLVNQWRWAWVLLGVLSLLPAIFALLFRLPASVNPQPGKSTRAVGLFRLAPALISYLLFGAGYIGYMTFVISTLRESGMGSWQFVSSFWVLLGLAIFVSSWVWAWLLDRSESGRGLALLQVVVCAGAVLPVLSTHPWAMLGSAALFGGSFLMVVSGTTALVRKALPKERWSQGIVAFTIAFALGQMVGPTLTGKVLDVSQSSTTGLAVSVLLVGIAAVVALLQRRVSTPKVSKGEPPTPAMRRA